MDEKPKKPKKAKTWVALTAEEVEAIFQELQKTNPTGWRVIDLYERINQALQEKNT